MTEIKKKVEAVKEKAVNVERKIKISLYQGFRGIIVIWAMVMLSYVLVKIATPENFTDPSGKVWVAIGLIITSLFLSINSHFKK